MLQIYIHRSGRTARASREGLSVVFVGPEEMGSYKKIMKTLNAGTVSTAKPINTCIRSPSVVHLFVNLINHTSLFVVSNLGSFSNDDRDDNENVKKALGLTRKLESYTFSTLSGTFFCRHYTTTTWNFLLPLAMENVSTRRRIFLSLSKV